MGEGHRRPRARARHWPRQGAPPPRVPCVCGAGRRPRRAQGRLDKPHRRTTALRAGRLRDRRTPRHLAETAVTTSTTVSLLRWLRRQLREPTPNRERLEAAIANDDPSEARRLLGLVHFNEAQRRHVESLLDEWERERTHG